MALGLESIARASPVSRRVALDLTLVGAAAGLVVATRAWGLALERRGVVILLAHAEPLMGPVRVRINIVTALVLVLGAAFVAVVPVGADRLAWRPLLGFSAFVALIWSSGLALVDGVHGGFAARLTGRDEYLHDLPLVTGNVLHVFAGGIQGHDGLKWTTHVAGHPPGALLTFWLLRYVGLSGAGPAAAFCVVAGALAIPAVLITVRSVAGEELARLTTPFLALAPAAIWVAVSADAWFLCVTAWGIALLACSAARRDAVGTVQALAGGVLLGFTAFLSYGLVLIAPVAIGVVLARRSDVDIRVRPGVEARPFASFDVNAPVGAGRGPEPLPTGAGRVTSSGPAGSRVTRFGLTGSRIAPGLAGRRVAPLGLAAVGAGCVLLAFAAGGFWWFDGLAQTRARVASGAAGARPYSYFLLADIAALAIAVGPATVAALSRLRRGQAVAWLAGPALLAIGFADLTGLSRGEVERIWLPFMPWMIVACGLLPARHRRVWLAAQVGVGISVQTVVMSLW